MCNRASIMQKAEQTLKADDPGVARHKFVIIVDKFLDRPHGKVVHSSTKDNSSVIGFRGEGSKFWVVVEPFGRGFLKAKGKAEKETEVFLYFQCSNDVKLHVQWSASITDPVGKALTKSTVLSTVLEKKNGKYEESELCHAPDGLSDVRMMEDVKFGLHKDITEKGWLFDGALHIVVDVWFKVLEGGFPETAAVVDTFLSAVRNQLDNPILPDFCLISADGQEIKTHKFILLLQSPVFRAMFENDLDEARTGICRIEDATEDSLRSMLAFLVGVEPEDWTFDLARSLFELADKYQLPKLLRTSAMELAKRLTVKNLSKVLLLASKHSAKTLLNEAFTFLEDHLTDATMDGVLIRLASKDMELLREWRAHWYRRREGEEMGEAEKSATESTE